MCAGGEWSVCVKGMGVMEGREVNCIKAPLPAVKFLGYIKRSTGSLAEALFFSISSPPSPLVHTSAALFCNPLMKSWNIRALN